VKMVVYGEDGLTLWALKNRLKTIIDRDDHTEASDCTVLYRPSFGRKGGDKSVQFGEFDFAILTRKRIYLGETKWHKGTSGALRGEMKLKDVQRLRHQVMATYIRVWFASPDRAWDVSMPDRVEAEFEASSINKLAPRRDSTTRRNLIRFLEIAGQRFAKQPEVKNILLVVSDDNDIKERTLPSVDGFRVVGLRCPSPAGESVVLRV
jgi:hypothetical protein